MIEPSTTTAIAPATPNAPATASTTDSDTSHSGFSFHDLLEIVNPLQHIPLVGTIYRAITGDKPNIFDKAAGDLLYGGPIGFIASLADTVYQKITGKDFGSTILGFFTGSGKTESTDAASTASGTQASRLSAATSGAFPSASPSQSPWTGVASKGVDAATAQQAALAYQRAITLVPSPFAAGSPAN
jgi:hypothetical protein